MQFEGIADFIRSIYGEGVIPLHEPRFLGTEEQTVTDCITSTFVSSVGKYVDQFEEEFAEKTGSPYAVAVVNGTAALHLSLHVLGVQNQHEVITQPLTFVATCNAIAHCGARPVFVDVDEDSMSLSPTALSKWLDENTERHRGHTINKFSGNVISVCMPMHTFGHPARMAEICEICEAYNIEVLEDAAEALGSFDSLPAGGYGKLSAFSLNGNKIITTGGGGMVVTGDRELAHKLKHLSTTAKVPGAGYGFYHDEVAFNYRMPNLNAALGCAQLELLDSFLLKKKEVARAYSDFFSNSQIKFVQDRPGTSPNHWLNAVLMPDQQSRDELLQFLNAQDILARPAWDLMHNLPMFSSDARSELPCAQDLYERLVNLPSSVPLV